jgi:TatD DNase family protein
MDQLPTLDAHGHLDAAKPAAELSSSGTVLAMTLSLDEAERALNRPAAGNRDEFIVWGAGCHPGAAEAQNTFDPGRFRLLAERAAFIGEIGLDKASRSTIGVQLRAFRAALETAAALGRPVSIHSMHATGLVLEELARTKVPAAVLHWWMGSAAETGQAVELGCWFSIHSAVARYSKFRTRVPAERVLVETDHGYHDPPAAIPARIQWVEHLVAQQYKMEVSTLRWQVWKNFGEIVRRTGVGGLLPAGVAAILDTIEP